MERKKDDFHISQMICILTNCVLACVSQKLGYQGPKNKDAKDSIDISADKNFNLISLETKTSNPTCSDRLDYLKNRVQLKVALLFSLLVSTRLKEQSLLFFNFEGHRPEHNSWQSVTGNNERPCWNSGVSVWVPQGFIVTKESTEIWIS